MSPESHETRPYANVNEETAARLLHFALLGAGHSVGHLVNRIEAAGESVWLENALERLGCGAALIDGTIGLSELRGLKDEAKRLHTGADAEQGLVGTAGYFAAIAGGFVHHDTSIGSYTRQELEETFLTLASVLSEPWSEFFQRAAFPD